MRKLITLKKLAIFVVWFSVLLSCSSKNKTIFISGTIYDEENKPLEKVEISNTTNNFVCMSSKNGFFSVKGEINDNLKFSYNGKPTKFHIVSKFTDNKVQFGDEKVEKIEKATTKPNPFKNKVIGKVIAVGLPLQGATVVIKGTSIGTLTNENGFYGIDAKINDVLVFSYLGYQTKEVKVSSKIVNVVLDNETETLEVVVTSAMGVKRSKSDEIGSVSSVKKDVLSVSPTPTAILEGKVSGISTSKSVSYEKEKIESSEKGFLSDDTATDKRAIVTSQKAGQLTAGEVNDFSNWKYWQGLTTEELLQWKNHWKFSPTFRYSLVVTNFDGYAVQNKKVHLLNSDNEIIWTAKTDNTGKAELWYKPNESVTEVTEKLSISDENKNVIISNAKEFHKGINTYKVHQNCDEKNTVNIAFMIDATGSMQDEISYLQAELFDVIARTKASLPKVELKMGSVFYRDHGDDYVVKNFDFTENISDLMSFMQNQSANQGGDFPEAVIEGLENSIEKLSWDENANTKLLFVLLDAPPHHDDEKIVKLQNLSKIAAEKGIRIIPIAASGIDKSTEFLMRAMALETNGTYLFISNHSGIGNNHIEPSTKSYKVEMLNDLILRIILQFSEVKKCISSSNYPKNTKIEEQIINNEEIKCSFFPNPTTDKFNVALNVTADEVFIFDTTGKLIVYKNEKSKNYQFDLTGFSNAIYYIKVIVNGTEFYGKIIKN